MTDEEQARKLFNQIEGIANSNGSMDQVVEVITIALSDARRAALEEAYRRTANLCAHIGELGMPDTVVSVQHWCMKQAEESSQRASEGG